MTPQAPDPMKTAAAQTNANISSSVASAYLNNINQSSPFGSINYTQDGFNSFTDPATGKVIKIPKFTSTTTLSPEQQALYDRQMSAGKNLGDLAVSQTGRLNNVLGHEFDPSGLPTAPDGSILANDYSADRRRVEDATLSRFNQDFDRTKAATETKLINQGITPGSEAWKAEMDGLGRQQNDAIMQAILSGGQEQSRLAGLDVQKLNTQTGLRNNSLQEALALRNQPINEISALMSGSGVTAPTFSSPYQQGVGGTDVAGAINGNYQNQLSSYNNNMSGLFGLGASIAKVLPWASMLSDRRAKQEIRRIGTTNDGQSIYLFRYKAGGPMQIGLMADEVAKRHPEAVHVRPDGLMEVDYAAALREAA